MFGDMKARYSGFPLPYCITHSSVEQIYVLLQKQGKKFVYIKIT